MARKTADPVAAQERRSAPLARRQPARPASATGERGARAQTAYAHIKQLLLNGVLKSGDRLRVNDLATELGISRQPVMAAIQRLAGEFLVEIIPQVGSIVRRPDRREVDDFYRYLAQSEGLLAELAAERAAPPQVKALEQALEAFAKALARKQGAARKKLAFNQLNRMFHELIHDVAQSAALKLEAQALLDRADFMVNSIELTATVEEDFAKAYGDHKAVVKAIRRGDGAGARQAMQDHILSSSPRFR